MAIPRILSAKQLDGLQILVHFVDGMDSIYDCRLLLERAVFPPLATLAFLRQIKVDSGGYGVSWSDEVDLSEYELWTKGRVLALVDRVTVQRPAELQLLPPLAYARAPNAFHRRVVF
jgi:hypothetical protein